MMPNEYEGWRVHITVEDAQLDDLNGWLKTPFANGNPPPAEDFFGLVYPLVPLSATGLDPATNWGGSGSIAEPGQRSWFVQTTAPPTCDYKIQNMKAPVNPGNPDFAAWVASLGLQIIPDSTSVPTAQTAAESQPDAGWLKAAIQAWLDNEGIPWLAGDTKAELLARIP
jgi:hypothetical protein